MSRLTRTIQEGDRVEATETELFVAYSGDVGVVEEVNGDWAKVNWNYRKDFGNETTEIHLDNLKVI